MPEPTDDLSPTRRQQALGVGLGISLVGAIALAIRYGFRKKSPSVLPESLSPEAFTTKVHQTTHGQVVYHVRGDGEPLVFLHGVYPGASSYEWSRVYPDFTPSHQVIAPDLIGFGESERPATALDLREHAEAMVEFLHLVCDGRSPTILASGVGAKVALLLASLHPELPKRMILWLPLGARRALRGRVARQMLGISRLPWMRSLAWKSYLSSNAFFERWVARFGFAEEGAEDPEVVSVLTNCAGLYQAEVAVWAYLQGSFAEDLTPRLKDIRCPMHLLWPESSAAHPLERGEHLQQELFDAELRLLRADGLLAPLRHPAYFREIMTEILREDSGGTDG